MMLLSTAPVVALPTLLLTGVVLLALHALRYLRHIRRMRKVAADIPGPPLKPLVGNAFELSGVSPENLLSTLYDMCYSHGDVARLWMGPTLIIYLRNPRDLEVFFTSPHMRSKANYAYGFASGILGEGLLTINSKGHRKHRKLVTPSLHYEILKDFLPVHQRVAASIRERVGAVADSRQGLNVTTMMGMYSMGALCETLFCTPPPESLRMHDVVELLERSGELILNALVKPWYQIRQLYKFSSRFDEFLSTEQAVSDFVTGILNKRSKELKETADKKQDKSKGKRMDAFLDRMLAPRGSEEALGGKELIEEMKSLTFAATVTTMDVLSMILLVLSLHPKVQRTAQEELDDIFSADPTRPVQEEDLPRMSYLELVIKEVLRLFPPVPMLGREVEGADVPLPGGYTIPEGATVIAAPYLTHRDPKHFPDPERFDPDRFLPENTRGRNPFAYIPFSAGSRNCVGQRYAMNSIKVLVSTLLRDFTFLPRPEGPKKMEDINILIGVTLSVVGGIFLDVERRSRA